MYKQITIQTLYKQGVKKSDIAKQLGCHRNTITNILARKSFSDKQKRLRSSVFDPHKETIKELLEKQVTRIRIHEILKEEHDVHIAYDSLRKYVKKHFPPYIEVFGVQQTDPGEEAEVDFGYLGMLPGNEGRLVKTWGLAVILSYSRVGYFAICCDQKLNTLCSELQQAFTYFGGVPKKLKVDNMKTAILKNQHYDLEFNQDFLEFANHYNTVIVPCTPYSPEQKGKVESGMKYLQQNFINGRTFVDDRDITTQLKDWMDNYANKRVHGTTKKVPMQELVEKERSFLQPLPQEEFAFFNRSIRKVAPNCHIHFENNYYSVPSSLVGKEVTVRWNEHLVRIIDGGEQVALHTKATSTGNFVTVRNHLPDYKVYSENERQVKYETRMKEIGSDAHEYFRWLLEQKEKYWFVIVRGIAGLCDKYGNDCMNKALKRALFYQVRDVVTIRHILEKKLYTHDLEPKLLDTTTPIQEEMTFYRELSYYCVQQ